MAVNTYKEDENVSNVSNMKTLLRTVSYLKGYKFQSILAIFMILLETLIVAMLPSFSERAVDVNIAQGDIRGLMITMGIASALAISSWLLTLGFKKILANVTNKIVYEIRRDAFDHLQTLSLYYFDSRPTGKILSRLINDVSSLKEMFTRLITSLIPNLTLIIAVVIASKIEHCLQEMRNRGISELMLREVHSPIGLAINAVTPQEIAVAIMAEIIAVFRADKKAVDIDPHVIARAAVEQGIMVRIIGKTGSAPRSVGSMMFVTGNSFCGTVGGGAIERHAIDRAKQMLSDGEQVLIEKHELSGKDKLGMICGGTNTLLYRLVEHDKAGNEN